MAENNWLLNDSFPLGLAQEFASPAAEWSATYWGPFALAFNAAQSGGTIYTYNPSGGIAFGGAAAVSKTKAFTASGGMQFAGVAAVSKTKSFTASGGVQFAGAALVSKTKSAVVDGGIAFGGAAAVSKTKAAEIGGGMQFGGAAQTQFVPAGAAQTYTYSPSGGIVFGGAAASLFQLATVQPASGDGRVWRWLDPRPQPVIRRAVCRGGMRFGGTAATSFHPVPALVAEPAAVAMVYEFAASGGTRFGGTAQATYIDAGKIRRKKNNRFILLLEAA